ncbi:protein TonB [Inhella inkyongensis]|uniref:Protein TonB n=1 Tax=Inhella inkyongensis TaxID=392593 RepID=A0A840S0P6_9BURK|nr:energy transducer TonB [Inhella inkyongensis]MBB5203835.1 protein TonB [Inhella inkyongensis]
MNFAQENQTGSRMTSFGIVVAIHVAMIYALASGLATKVVEAVKGPIETKVVKEPPPPPPEPEKIVPPPPDLKAPPPPFVPIPEVSVQTPPAPNAIVTQSTTPQPVVTKPEPAPAPAPVAAPAPRPEKVSAGMLCPTLVKPEMPALSIEGVAEMKVLGTVKGGRVVAIEFTKMAGISDRRAQRSLKGAIEAALGQYKCSSDGIFEQEFIFRIEG